MRLALNKECGWKDGDRGGAAQSQRTTQEKTKTVLTRTGLLMEGGGDAACFTDSRCAKNAFSAGPSHDSHQKEDSMKSTISRLLDAYENRKMSRRELVQGLALLAASSATASAAGFQGNSINHLSLFVSNLQRSTDFYQRVFGCSVNKREGNNQLTFGKGFLVLRLGNPPGKVDHFAIGVDNFNKDSVGTDLKGR